MMSWNIWLLPVITETVTFHVYQDERKVEAIGAIYQIPYKRFFLETHSQQGTLVTQEGAFHSITSSATRRGDSSPPSRGKLLPEFS